MERKQDEALQSMFNGFERTINDINIQYNTRTENRNVEDNNIQTKDTKLEHEDQPQVLQTQIQQKKEKQR